MVEPGFAEYDSLPLHKESGRRSAWGHFDRCEEKDHLGALNHLTAERKVAAAKEVTYGISVQLDLRNDSIKLPAFGRLGIQHKVIDYEHITGEFAHDDELAFNTQSGSQWDGFLHYADQKIGTYFNGVRHSDSREAQAEAAGIHCMCVHVSLSNGTLTVSTDWCEQGIVARGVLLDWVRWCQDTTGTTIAPISTHGITTEDLDAIALHQGVTIQPGDVVLLRTGFVKWYVSAMEDASAKAMTSLAFAGLKAGEATERWLWNNRIAAVACDTVGLEEFPPPKNGTMLHQWMLPHAGIPIGELWNLESLAEACQKHSKWAFMLTSAPLNIFGGVASPPNVLAIL